MWLSQDAPFTAGVYEKTCSWDRDMDMDREAGRGHQTGPMLQCPAMLSSQPRSGRRGLGTTLRSQPGSNICVGAWKCPPAVPCPTRLEWRYRIETRKQMNFSAAAGGMLSRWTLVPDPIKSPSPLSHLPRLRGIASFCSWTFSHINKCHK